MLKTFIFVSTHSTTQTSSLSHFIDTNVVLHIYNVNFSTLTRNLARSPVSSINMNYEETELTLGLPGESRGTKRSVLGWPPVKEHRKCITMSRRYVKVGVDGAPYLRKVDLQSYDSYDQLLSGLQELFGCFTQSNENKLVDCVNGTLEYVPTYEDKDGDWMLLGDVPWKMFAESCKRLRLMTRTPSF